MRSISSTGLRVIQEGTVPAVLDIEAEFDRDFTFTFDEEVAQELREMIADLGIVDGLGAE